MWQRETACWQLMCVCWIRIPAVNLYVQLGLVSRSWNLLDDLSYRSHVVVFIMYVFKLFAVDCMEDSDGAGAFIETKILDSHATPELEWHSGSVMDCHATARGSIPGGDDIFTELHVLRKGQ